MNDSTNSSLGNASGGNTVTGNPQNIGSQTIITPPDNLQSSSNSLLSVNGSNLQLTDPNGNPIDLGHTTIAPAKKTQPASSSHGLAVFGVSFVIIIAIVATTWLMSRQSNSY